MVRLRSVSLSVLCLLASLPALAATHVWTGAADSRFSNAANWIGGSPAGDAAAELSFPATSRATATNDLTGLTVRSIDFSAAGFTISGNTITLAANGSVIDTSRDVNTIACDLVLAGDVTTYMLGDLYDQKGLTFSGAISGSGGMTIRGGGHVVYTGSRPNSYSGSTRLQQGGLQLEKSPNVTSIAGDLEIGNDGSYAFLSVLYDEQIANSAHVTVGNLAKFGCSGTETLGPLTLVRGADLQASAQWSGNIQMTGTVILTGDIEITGSAQAEISMYGAFLLQGMRTITANANYGEWSFLNGPGQKSAGSGIILNTAAYSDGTFSSVLDFRQATYDGPTIINGGEVSIDAPHSAVDLQKGRYAGHCKSLTAEGGVLYLHGYLGGVASEGDVKLGPGATVAFDGSTLTMNGTLDLGGATLQMDAGDYSYGLVRKVIDNSSTKPVIGTFANLPEGATIANHYRISYVGGDGNDVTLTDVGLIPPDIRLSLPSFYPEAGTPIEFTATVSAYQHTPTGTVTFSAGTTVLGTAPLTNGVATLTAGASLPRGHYLVTAAYSGDSRVAPRTSNAADLYVVAPAPTLTSIDPQTIPAGVKTTLVLHGTNFVDGTFVYISSFGYPTTFVSPSELRFDYTPFASESDFSLEVWVVQPDQYGARQSARLKLNVSGVKKPTPPPSPFTFSSSDLTTTLTGVTPGAMTLWLAVARGNIYYNIDSIVTDTDHDGSVTLPFPFKASAMPQGGIWLVADLSAHTIVFDNPSRTAPAASPFPAKAFLRDAGGHYTHVQFPVTPGTLPSLFAWARPGAGAWIMFSTDGADGDEDGGTNGRVTFETSAMTRTPGTTATAPADGIKAGDMFLVIDSVGQTWWGDTVDAHVSESDGPGKLGFVVATTRAAETSGNATILVQRTEGTDGTVTVKYATADGTAIAGRDYAARAGVLTFGPGETLKTIEIPLVDNHAYTGDTDFKVTLSDAAGAPLGLATHTVTIRDDERQPELSLALPATSMPEGDSGRVDIPITVTLNGLTALPVTVNWYFAESSGNSHTGQLQFAPGETRKTFTVFYTADTIPGPDRIINMHLWNPTNATVTEGTTLRIIDDDFAGVSIADGSVVESAGKVVLPVQLSRSSQKQVTVSYETRSVSALAALDFVSTSGTITMSAGSTITIPIVNDAFREPLEVFEVVLTSVNGGRIDRSVATVTIIDDDDSGPPPPPLPSRRRTTPH